jgi:hypothetical protein
MPGIGHLVRFKIFCSLFFLLVSSFLYCQEYPDTLVNSLIKKGLDYTISQDYESAAKVFKKLDNKYPDLPFGKIYLAADEIAKAYDFGDELNDELISDYLDTAVEKSQDLLDSDDNNIWNLYFFALSKGYYAYYEALNKNWFSAISNGFDSFKYFEKCLQIDSSFYAAYTAIGNFKYWKSRKASWLPFVSDDTEEGIKNLLKAIQHSSNNEYMAVYSLQWIYIDQKKYEDAVRISKIILKKYPENRLFKWGLARAYEGIDRRSAIQIYYEILNSYKKENKLNYVNEILLKHLIAQQYEKLGDLDSALQLCNDILSIDYSSSKNNDRIERRIERVKELKKNILERVKD